MDKHEALEVELERSFDLEQDQEESKGFMEPPWWDELDVGEKYTATCTQIVKDFVLGRLKQRTVYDTKVRNGAHIYTTRKNGTELWLFKDNPSVKVRVCVAKKIKGVFIGNASSLSAIKNPKTGDINWVPSGPFKIQNVLSEVMVMIPFRTFSDAKLSLNSMEIIEKGPDRFVELEVFGSSGKTKLERRHLTGAILFNIGKGKKLKQYLFDADENELALNNLNLFISEIPVACGSIQEAYDSLKPQEVKDAERFLKRPCPRQGEWFFIPSFTEHKKAGAPDRMAKMELSLFRAPTNVRAVLQTPGSRPHWAQHLSEDGLVSGRIGHSGLDHKPIILKGWHKPIPNTSKQSFKVSGDVD